MKTGLIIGIAVGTIAGAVGGAAAAEFCPLGPCAYPTNGEQVGMGLAGAAVGALIGGALGAAIAAPIRRWKTVYRREGRMAPVVSATRVGVALAF